MEVFFRAFKLKNIKRFFHSKKNERIESSFISSNLFENPTSFDFLFFSISFFSFFLRIESWKETFVNNSNETPIIKIYFGTGERVPHVFKE
ncbi:hypothetical protein B9T54_05365 [Leptospira borgpetersenii serovar Hardjo-bovis]|nr:hypothetical protein B9T54_05365 [Leptospira borgpetersenii serovar Hardjo-bovis]